MALLQLFSERQSVPFGWGQSDCMLFAADAVLAMTGKDPMSWARGKYKNREQAAEMVYSYSDESFHDTFKRIFMDLGFEETSDFCLGDIALIKTQNLDPVASKLFCGLCFSISLDAPGKAFCQGRDGIVLVEDFQLRVAWTL